MTTPPRTPTTAAGRLMLDWWHGKVRSTEFHGSGMESAILAIEAEAVAAERARLWAAVEGQHNAICACPNDGTDPDCNGNGLFDTCSVLALLEPQP